jgi:hypothetical protein
MVLEWEPELHNKTNFWTSPKVLDLLNLSHQRAAQPIQDTCGTLLVASASCAAYLEYLWNTPGDISILHSLSRIPVEHCCLAAAASRASAVRPLDRCCSTAAAWSDSRSRAAASAACACCLISTPVQGKQNTCHIMVASTQSALFLPLAPPVTCIFPAARQCTSAGGAEAGQ